MVRSAPRSARVPLETTAVVRMSAAFECYCAAFAADCLPTPSWDKHAFNRLAVAPLCLQLHANLGVYTRQGTRHARAQFTRARTHGSLPRAAAGAHAGVGVPGGVRLRGGAAGQPAPRVRQGRRRARAASPLRRENCMQPRSLSSSPPPRKGTGVILSQFARACGCDGHWWSAGSSMWAPHHGASAGVEPSAHAALTAARASCSRHATWAPPRAQAGCLRAQRAGAAAGAPHRTIARTLRSGTLLVPTAMCFTPPVTARGRRARRRPHGGHGAVARGVAAAADGGADGAGRAAAR